MEKIINWFKESNRYKHFIGGALIGFLADDVYCALIAGCGVAGALEYKDYQWGGTPDWIDFAITVAGTAVGFCIRCAAIAIFI